MPTLTIDGNEIEVEAGLTVLQACEQAGIEIPRFCYHERLSIAGSCRMCLVEMEKAPKLIASCAMPVGDGMVIHTNTDKVVNARKGVMELLLINHPLDCPICDQGGECDLQDQAVAYGIGQGRYTEAKRAVEEKSFGPLVATEMTRCIQCTRCVRFSSQVCGTPELGGIGRGEHMEITTYVDRALSSELSGNLIDLCPVGALTSKPYSFTARPWELTKTESIDVFDAIGSNIRIDSKGGQVLRVMPRVHEEVNEEWISDKSRFAIDGLSMQRIDRPYIRRNGKLAPATWAEALKAAGEKLGNVSGAKFAAIAGDQADCEAMLALKELTEKIGSANIDCRQDGAKLDAGNRASYLFNSTIAGIDEADAILLVGVNPRWEAPVLNARIRERYLQGGLKVGMIGEALDLTYPYEHVGTGPADFTKITGGKSDFAKVLKSAEKPMVILGAGVLTRQDGADILGKVRTMAENRGMIKDGWNGFNVLHTAASRVGGLDLGFVPGDGGKDVAGILESAALGDIDVVYLLGADEIDTSKLDKAFVIYQGHHGDAGANCADIVLPGSAYSEKSGTFVNTEGRVQRSQKAVFAPGEAKDDWAIVRALSDAAGKTLPYNNLNEVRARLAEINPIFGTLDEVQSSEWADFGGAGEPVKDAFTATIDNFYMTDPISRVSKTMAECTEVYIRPQTEQRTGTDG